MFHIFSADKKEMVPVSLYNTLTKKQELVNPIVPGEIRLYTCGPTVYSEPQIGNLRAYIFSDTLKRTLQNAGYTVHQVINITDVGHLVSDADDGEDKMEKAAAKSGERAEDIAKRITEIFFENLRDLNCDVETTQFPRATEYIKEQIALVQTLEEKGYTYPTSDGIYFDTSRFPAYGALGGIDIEGLKAGARVAVSNEKRNPTDFALWKFSPSTGGQRQQEWQSPWGMGFPGWHIECSAMSRALLGKHLDIHTGGIDHIPVHHNNEIAQSECGSGEKFVNIWMHNAFLTIDGNRIGKSVGNAITLREVMSQGYDPLAIRYLFLGAHYRSQMNFSFEALDGAQSALKRLRAFATEHYNPDKGKPIPAVMEQILEACTDDLGTAQALAAVFAMLNFSAYKVEDKAQTLVASDMFFGLKFLQKDTDVVPESIQKMLQEREQARTEKRWKDSDSIRDAIGELGYIVKDTHEGQKIEKK
ncbi:MAG: hypothetical protein RI911_680 [Candidatus Parcubacteria bacterium]|jgi:cysteinyl-tRNA synthetase